ncbi:MAG: aldo/keto reductase, partial [Ilumatobacteraceae bacterium]
MEYRRLGSSGLKVSALGFGSWVTFDTQMDLTPALECMQAARDAGCNFFDNAEAYAGGKSEEIMGRALRELGWPRWSYVVTTKLYWGIHDDPNMKFTLNRKYLMHGIDGTTALHLNDEDLQDYGVAMGAHRRNLLRMFASTKAP